MLEKPPKTTEQRQRWRDLFFAQPPEAIKACKERFARQMAILLQQAHPNPDLACNTTRLAKYVAGHVWHCQMQISDTGLVTDQLDYLYFHLARWAPNRGRLGREFPNHLATTMTLLESPPEHTAELWLSASQAIEQFHDNWQSRASALEQRQLAGEINLDRLDLAKSQVAQKINSVLSGSVLPSWLTQFITQILCPDLASASAREDLNCDIDQWLLRLTDLRDVYCHASNPDATPEQRQWLYSVVPNLIDLYTEANFDDIPDRPEYQANFDRLSQSLIDCIRSQSEPTEAYKPASSNNTTDEVKLSGSQNSFDQFAISQGQWFHYACDDEMSQAYKLFYLCHSSGKAYFSDYYGKIRLMLNCDELKLLLAAKHLLPIASFKPTLATLLDRYLEQEELHHRKCVAASQVVTPSADTHKPSSITEQLETGSSSLPKCEATEKSIKKINEDIANAMQPVVEPTPVTASTKSQPEIDDFVAAIGALQLGAWVKFSQTSKGLHKLALKLPSSDKYLFTDRLGRKSGEFKMHDLVELFQRDAIEIISSGERFDSRLEKIVKNQRR